MIIYWPIHELQLNRVYQLIIVLLLFEYYRYEVIAGVLMNIVYIDLRINCNKTSVSIIKIIYIFVYNEVIAGV